jgi:hypothetical protein
VSDNFGYDPDNVIYRYLPRLMDLQQHFSVPLLP